MKNQYVLFFNFLFVMSYKSNPTLEIRHTYMEKMFLQYVCWSTGWFLIFEKKKQIAKSIINKMDKMLRLTYYFTQKKSIYFRMKTFSFFFSIMIAFIHFHSLDLICFVLIVVLGQYYGSPHVQQQNKKVNKIKYSRQDESEKSPQKKKVAIK